MNEYFEEYTREQKLVPVAKNDREDPRYTKNADALYQPPPAVKVLRALCVYPGIDGPMFDNAIISHYDNEVAIELDDLTHTTYIFGEVS